jgi:Ca2+-binding RTX toxin-like protein
LIGDAGDNNIEGRDGDDIIVGGGGNDYLVGGDGVDTFVFSNLIDEGADTVVGFVAGTGGDILDFSTFALADANAALALGTDVGGNAVFTLASGTEVVLENVNMASLTADNFLI